MVAEKTKNELIKLIQKHLNTDDVELFIEYGSKTGIKGRKQVDLLNILHVSFFF